jgi:murein DD-endopeptidase MepM/ murein hydrolase activator NlpD
MLASGAAMMVGGSMSWLTGGLMLASGMLMNIAGRNKVKGFAAGIASRAVAAYGAGTRLALAVKTGLTGAVATGRAAGARAAAKSERIVRRWVPFKYKQGSAIGRLSDRAEDRGGRGGFSEISAVMTGWLKSLHRSFVAMATAAYIAGKAVRDRVKVALLKGLAAVKGKLPAALKNKLKKAAGNSWLARITRMLKGVQTRLMSMGKTALANKLKVKLAAVAARIAAKVGGGAAVGSAFPGLGTIVGAVVGVGLAVWDVITIVTMLKDVWDAYRSEETSAAAEAALEEEVDTYVEGDVTQYYDEDYEKKFDDVTASFDGYQFGGFVRPAKRKQLRQMKNFLERTGEQFVDNGVGRDLRIPPAVEGRVGGMKDAADYLYGPLVEPWTGMRLKRRRRRKAAGTPSGAFKGTEGPVQRFAKGGVVKGRRKGRDTELALVEPGEYILTRRMTDMIGQHYLEDLRLGSGSALRGIGGAGLPAWLTDASKGMQHDYSLINFGLSEQWIEREIARLKQLFKEQGKYALEYEEQFTSALTSAVTSESQKKQAEKAALDKAMELKKAQVAFDYMYNYSPPKMAGIMDTVSQVMPPVEGLYGYDFSFMNPAAERDAFGRLVEKTDGDAAAARELMNQIKLGGEFESALLAAYIAARDEKIRQEAEAAAAAAREAAAAAAGNMQPDTQRPPGNTGVDDGATIVTPKTPSTGWNGPPDTTSYTPWHTWYHPLFAYKVGNVRSSHRPVHAIDFPVPSFTPVRAVSEGVVTMKKDLGRRSYGRFLTLRHVDRGKIYHSLYAHLNRWFTGGPGASVKGGSKIAESGNTGGSTGPHLHFELTPNSGGIMGTTEALRRMRVMVHVNQYGSQSRPLTGPGRTTAFADGGVVRATSGVIDAVIAEGGHDARVIPLDRYGRSESEVEIIRSLGELFAGDDDIAVTNHVHTSDRPDVRRIAAIISKEVAFSKRRFA